MSDYLALSELKPFCTSCSGALPMRPKGRERISRPEYGSIALFRGEKKNENRNKWQKNDSRNSSLPLVVLHFAAIRPTRAGDTLSFRVVESPCKVHVLSPPVHCVVFFFYFVVCHTCGRIVVDTTSSTSLKNNLSAAAVTELDFKSCAFEIWCGKKSQGVSFIAF